MATLASLLLPLAALAAVATVPLAAAQEPDLFRQPAGMDEAQASGGLRVLVRPATAAYAALVLDTDERILYADEGANRMTPRLQHHLALLADYVRMTPESSPHPKLQPAPSGPMGGPWMLSLSLVSTPYLR